MPNRRLELTKSGTAPLVLLIGLVFTSLFWNARAAIAFPSDDITVVYRVVPPDTALDPRDRAGFVPMGHAVSLGYTTDELWIGFEANDATALADITPLIVRFTPAFTHHIDLHLLDRTRDTLDLVASCGASSRDRTGCNATGLPGAWTIPDGRIADVLIRFGGPNALNARIDFVRPRDASWNLIVTMMAIGALIALALLSASITFVSFSQLPILFAIFAILQALHSALLVGVPQMLFPKHKLTTLFDLTMLALVAAGWALHYRAIHEIARPGSALAWAVALSSCLSAGAILTYIVSGPFYALQLNMIHLSIMPVLFLSLLFVSSANNRHYSRSELTLWRLLLVYLVLFALTVILPVTASFGFTTPQVSYWNILFVMIFFGFVTYRHMIEQALANEREAFDLRLAAEREKTNARLAKVYTEATIGGMTTHLSHEMRTPLATLLTSVSNLRAILSGDISSHRDAGRNLDRIERAVSRMRSVMDGVNAFIRSPRITGKTSLTRAVRQSLALVESRLHTEQITCTIAAPTEDIYVQADTFDVETAVLNIIVNAFDAVAAQPIEPRCVWVTLRNEAGIGSVIVTDNGGGIPGNDAERLFEPLFTTKPEGTGLGLPLAKQMAERWGGAIRITNHAEGAQAIVAFPLAHDPDADHV